MKQYQKFLAQVVVTVLAAVAAALAGNNHIDVPEAINIVIVGLGAIAVLGAGNLPAGVWAHTKAIVSGATAGAVFLQSALSDGISPAEWVQCVIAIAGAVGVFVARGPLVEVVGRHEAP